jgi:hypothetical protein
MGTWSILERYPDGKVLAVSEDGTTYFTGTVAQLNEQFNQTLE